MQTSGPMPRQGMSVDVCDVTLRRLLQPLPESGKLTRENLYILRVTGVNFKEKLQSYFQKNVYIRYFDVYGYYTS